MKTKTFADAISAWKSNRFRAVISTGIKPLDDQFAGGLPVRQITTLGAYTGQRKSELARQIARNAMLRGTRVVYVDIELGMDRIFERFYVQEMKMPRAALADDDMFNEEERRESEEVLDSFSRNDKMHFFTPGNMPPLEKLIDELSAKLDALYEESRNPVLVILDSIQRISMGQNLPSQRECMMRFMASLEQFSRTHNAAVLAISELRRDPKGGIPKGDKLLSSLAESRAIEYVSDAVMFLVQDKNHKVENETAYHVVIAKNRNGEQDVTVDCKFVFLYPFWGMRIDSDAMVALQLAVLKFFEAGPSTIDECAAKLKKRRTVIAKITREYEAIKKIKPYKSHGSKHFQLVSVLWDGSGSENPEDLDEIDPDCRENLDLIDEENQDDAE